MYIKDKNILELIYRMLGYLGWAARDSVLAKHGFVRDDIVKLSELIKVHGYKEAVFLISEENIELLRKVCSYFQKEEKRIPSNLHTLTGFGSALLDKLTELISQSDDNVI